jgi:hypothetical protein
VWLRLSVLEPGGRRVYLRFGDPAALAASGSVWESSVGVYHMAGDLAAGVHDSSTRALDGAAPGVAPDPQGKLGQAAAFDGAQSHIDIGMVSDFDVPPGEARTVQLWFRRNTTSYAAMSIVRTRNTCCTGYGLLILPDEWANMRHDIGIGSCCTMNLTDYSLTPFSLPAAANDTDWHQATVVMDRGAGASRIYFDGELRQSGMLPTTGDMAGDNVGFGVDEYGQAFMNGSIDEVRVDTRAYSDSWVTVQYRSESDTLLTFGPIEPL